MAPGGSSCLVCCCCCVVLAVELCKALSVKAHGVSLGILKLTRCLLLLLMMPLLPCVAVCCWRQVTGTPGFRAPEVMDVGWGKAADTYAFGIIAWQLLTGDLLSV